VLITGVRCTLESIEIHQFGFGYCMCDNGDSVGIIADGSSGHDTGQVYNRPDRSTQSFARYLVATRQEYSDFPTRCANGFISYGEVGPKDKVLVAVTNHHEREVVDSVVHALKEKGAKVDVLVQDHGPDDDIKYDTEIKLIIRTEGWWKKPRWYDYYDSILNYAKDNGYTLVIHGRGGPIPKMNAAGETLPFRLEAIPWQSKEGFLWDSTIFPPKLNYLINLKSWNIIYKQGRGGKVRLTDPEGTDLEFTLNEKYFDRNLDERGGFGPRPTLGHLLSHPTPPIIAEDDTHGVIAGTTSHITKPFPTIKVEVQDGLTNEILGGGGYGDAWRELLEETNKVHYPEFPRNGLFWIWEMAIGTNPKVRRPSNVLRLSSGGNEIERSRSGVIHVGFGTRWRGESERWAAERGIKYGHLHVHLLFPTYRIKTPEGKTLTVIENGRLQALDDPEVKDLAKKYGDPEELLREDWVPKIPGINSPGKYEDYGKDPADWMKKVGW
jgi:hypothetical protein